MENTILEELQELTNELYVTSSEGSVQINIEKNLGNVL